MSDATYCEIIIGGVVASDSLQTGAPATYCELIIAGAVASDVTSDSLRAGTPATTCEIVIAGAVASDSLQTRAPSTACELVIGGAVAQSALELKQGRAGQTAHENEQSEQTTASEHVQISAAYRVQVAEQINASDTLLETIGREHAQAEQVGASARVQVSVQHRVEILETLSAADSHQPKQQANVTLLDAVFASDTLKDGDAALIYTAKTDSLAMSVLTPESPINGLALVQGELAASGAEGLYRFTGKPLAPFIQSGWLHPEGGQLWRAQSAYLQHSGEPLTLHLTISDGVEQTYPYSTEPRLADASVPSKIKLGRGIRAKALRLGLSGEAFVLDGGELVINPLSRNV